MTRQTLLLFLVSALLIGCAHFQPDPIPKGGEVPDEVSAFRATSSIWWIPTLVSSEGEKTRLRTQQKTLAAERVQLETDKANGVRLAANAETDLSGREKKNAAELIAATYRWQENPGITTEQRKAFLVAGLNLSDHLADEWLEKQLKRDTDSRYWKNSVNTALSLTTAALGWTSAAGTVVTAVGASGAAVNAQWSNYEAAYLLSSAMPKVVEKLNKYRSDLRKEILIQFAAKSPSYLETRDIIDKYHETVSREAVKNFIDSSVELAEARYKTADQSSLGGIEVKAANLALYNAVHGQPGEFGMDELTALYLQMIDPAGTKTTALEASGPVSSLLTNVKSKRATAAGGGAGAPAAKVVVAEIDRALGQVDRALGLKVKAEALKNSGGNGAQPSGVLEQINFIPTIQSVR